MLDSGYVRFPNGQHWHCFSILWMILCCSNSVIKWSLKPFWDNEVYGQSNAEPYSHAAADRPSWSECMEWGVEKVQWGCQSCQFVSNPAQK